MKHLFIIFSILFAGPVIAQNKKDDKGRKQGKWVKTYPKSTIKSYQGQFKDDKPYGEFKYWYESGKVKAIMKYTADGSGAYAKMYHEAGQYLMAKGNYVNKVKDSTWLYYDQRGRLSYEESYVNGKLEGERIVYYVDGVPGEKGYYTDENGMPRTGGTAVYKPGLKYVVEHYKNGVKHGAYLEYYGTGKLKKEANFIDGNYEGKVTHYYSNGKVEKISNYKHAVRNGAFIWFDETGKKLKTKYYLNNIELKGEKLEKYKAKMKAKAK